jgi:hypothetical protein
LVRRPPPIPLYLSGNDHVDEIKSTLTIFLKNTAGKQLILVLWVDSFALVSIQETPVARREPASNQ